MEVGGTTKPDLEEAMERLIGGDFLFRCFALGALGAV